MSLDIAKLKNVSQKGDKTTAQCPACAAKGDDSKAEHLVIFSGGKFGCAAHQHDKEHRNEIFRLAGLPSSQAGCGPVPVPIRRPLCLTKEPKVICTLRSLARPAAAIVSVEPVLTQTSTPDHRVDKPEGNGEDLVQTVCAKSEAIPEPPSKIDSASLNGSHSFRMRSGLLIAVKDGPDWETRLEDLKCKHSQN